MFGVLLFLASWVVLAALLLAGVFGLLVLSAWDVGCQLSWLWFWGLPPFMGRTLLLIEPLGVWSSGPGLLCCLLLCPLPGGGGSELSLLGAA